MPLYETTFPTIPYQSVNAGVVPADVYGVAINWYINRNPLATRLPKLPVGSFSFLITNDNYRARSQALTSSYSTTATAIVVTDTSMYMPGDILEVDAEQFKVTAIASSTNLTVTYAYGGTTNANHSSGAIAYLIGRAATGADVDLQALSRNPAPVTQYVQVFQHAYQVGGGLNSATNYVSGFNSPLDRDRMMAIQHVMDDFETSAYYGAGQALGASEKYQQMKGLRALISTNKTTSPTNAAAYKPSDLTRDTLQKCFDNGGNPSLLLVSTDFLTGLAIWGVTAQRLNAGATAFGTPIDLFMVPFLGGVPFVPSPMLRPGTAICLSTAEALLRMKRPLFEVNRGPRGDAVEGDFIMEGAVELLNESHHAWVSGITAFAAA